MLNKYCFSSNPYTPTPLHPVTARDSRYLSAIHPYTLVQTLDFSFSCVSPDLDELAKLPFHHRDPFDRLIIAQSLVESLPIITKDTVFESYPV